MKGKNLKHPYKGYIGYKVFHRKENRFYVCMVNKKDRLKRKTISLARYKMSVFLGRKLLPTEHVDHIDGNKTNDKLNNLQILTQKQNNLKSIKERGKQSKLVKLKCPICFKIFKREPRLVNYKLSQGKQPCCSRDCGRIKTSMTLMGR